MAPSDDYQSKLHLACEPSATRYALFHAKDVLPVWGLPRDVVADALVIVDELVTNAVRHAGTPSAAEQRRPTVRPSCALALQLESSSLVIAVYDQDNRLPVLRPLSYDAEVGRGMQLVAGLTDGQWGYAQFARQLGKVVWARLPLPMGWQPIQPQVQSGQPPPSVDRRMRLSSLQAGASP